MAGESPTYIAIGAGGSVILMMLMVAFFKIKKIKKSPNETLTIVNKSSTSWYDPQFQKAVPEQVGQGDIYIEEGLLAVFTAEKRSKSAEFLPMETSQSQRRSSSLASSRHLSVSSQSLTSLSSETFSVTSEDIRRNSFTLRGSPYVEFNLLWATSSSSLSVYVVRITSLPPTYHNATCSYKVTLHKPDNTSVSKSSNKVKKVNLNPDCPQVFSFQVPLKEVRNSKLEVEVYARKSKQFLSKAIGNLEYDIPSDLIADYPVTKSQPLTIYKKGNPVPASSPRDSTVSLPGSIWGQVQILAQYQIRGGWHGRIKMVVIKAHNSLVGKRGGAYKMELIVKKDEETEAVQETKLAPGPNPFWNMPFIFDVSQSKVQDYRVEMTLVRTSRMKKSTIIGHVALGLNTTPSGTRHWEDLVASPNKEFTVWHPITCLEE
ncbi:synaptotagmin-7-like [Macrobrachium rosenbergii]|uniref:synaptotagmin-7-like n=1 Tax=Macrobrachium rosenbergii TaxID=79674 RepID=UPI0034D76951